MEQQSWLAFVRPPENHCRYSYLILCQLFTGYYSNIICNKFCTHADSPYYYPVAMPEAVLHWHCGFVLEVAGPRLVADFRCIREADRSSIPTAHPPHRLTLGMPSLFTVYQRLLLTSCRCRGRGQQGIVNNVASIIVRHAFGVVL